MQNEVSSSQNTLILKRSLKSFIHDIRNPLSAIEGFAEILEDTSLDEEQKEVLELLKRACTNLSTVLDREISPQNES